jgi:hypothetical protein
MSATNPRLARLPARDDFRKVFALATQTSLALLTVVVVSRRLAGVFYAPLGSAVPCFVATFAAVLSLAALALWRQATPSASTKTWILGTAMALAVLTPLALGAALWITPSVFVGGYLAALAMASLLVAAAIEDAAAGFTLTDRVRRAWFEREPESTPASIAQEPTICPSVVTAAEPIERPVVEAPASAELAEPSEEDETADDSIVQWMTRRRLADGGEVIEGAVRIDLDPSETVGVAHLSFSPPLPCDPEADCHLLSDFDGRVRVTAARSYGLRIEARQAGESKLAATLTVAFSAQARPAATRAAAA